ncbi:hypothetical protein PGTUg99_036964 [Puccinia graminis f. sp. tritici]|uniref:Uncharacterized protein n=1 Tax=Puccinia graminis f. sp. tritici TaxID=56615 RepID=A0A5B0RS75_PUCGR|nr:hypothetical protein PGTUg99_036964 [Puccinia graminis f. sp. tritici]
MACLISTSSPPGRSFNPSHRNSPKGAIRAIYNTITDYKRRNVTEDVLQDG